MADSTLHVGIKIAQDAPIESFRQVWAIADEAGFDHCWAFDHLTSVGPIGPDRPVFDSWSMLAAMAVATRRPRLGVLVSGVTYRHPALLAKMAVTIDHLSGGRLEFGIGTGWSEEDHRMYGIDNLERKVGRLSEALSVLTMLWTQERSDFSGQHYRLDDAIANPKPVQRPYPPIWIGAAGPTMLKLAARHANVWNLVGDAGATPSYEKARETTERFEAACAAVGRDPAEVRRSVQLRFDGGDPAELIEDLARFHEAGFTEIIVYVGGDDPVRAAATVAERLLPRARRLAPSR